MAITKDTTIGEALRQDRRTAIVFNMMGMHCIGCPMSSGETVEEACAVHGVDVETIVKQLNAVTAEN